MIRVLERSIVVFVSEKIPVQSWLHNCSQSLSHKKNVLCEKEKTTRDFLNSKLNTGVFWSLRNRAGGENHHHFYDDDSSLLLFTWKMSTAEHSPLPLDLHSGRHPTTYIHRSPATLPKSSVHLVAGLPTLRLPVRGLHLLNGCTYTWLILAKPRGNYLIIIVTSR